MLLVSPHAAFLGDHRLLDPVCWHSTLSIYQTSEPTRPPFCFEAGSRQQEEPSKQGMLVKVNLPLSPCVRDCRQVQPHPQHAEEVKSF